MAMVSASEVLKKRGNGERVKLLDDVCIATNKTGNAGSGNWCIVFSISSVIAKKARFLLGDTVDFLFDAEKKIGILKRTTEGGWKLATCGKDFKSRMYLKLPYTVGMPAVARNTACLSEVTSDGISLVFPDEVSFTCNPRESEGTE